MICQINYLKRRASIAFIAFVRFNASHWKWDPALRVWNWVPQSGTGS